jgi:hypothetical protein
MTPSDRADDQATQARERSHPHAGKTPEAEAAQLANLTPLAPLKHGAYSAERLRPERERFLSELQAAFQGVRHDRLELAAGRRARIELLRAYLDDVGMIAHRRRGTFRPFLAVLQKDETAYLAELAVIEELAAKSPPGGTSPQAVIDRHTGRGKWLS